MTHVSGGTRAGGKHVAVDLWSKCKYSPRFVTVPLMCSAIPADDAPGPDLTPLAELEDIPSGRRLEKGLEYGEPDLNAVGNWDALRSPRHNGLAGARRSHEELGVLSQEDQVLFGIEALDDR